MLGELASARVLAAESGDGDLVERIDRATEQLRAADIAVAVVGEFKQGKSTLINALLRTDVCPVDADVVTAAPMTLRFGRPPAASADGVPIDLADVGKHLDKPLEVRLDRRLLGAGLSLVDTPGVGGLDSAQGNITLALLPSAGAALFVTDAAQELTAPEVDFLRRTVERCPRTFCVLTKTDLHVQWRRIVQLNEGHLRRAGLDVPIVPVSSFLRARAQARDDTALNEESGYPRLVDLLRRDVLEAAMADRIAAAKAELSFVVDRLRERADAEHAALRGTPGVAQRYAEKARRSAALTNGTWQTVLGDGIQDLAADVDHDLRERLRRIVREGEEVLAGSDPRDTWQDFQAWAAREAAAAAADNLLLLVSRTQELAAEVASRFGLECDRLELDLPVPELTLGKAAALDVSFQQTRVQQFLRAFTAARVSYGGFYLLGAVGALFSVPWAAPLGLIAGLTLGRRLMKMEKERQVQQRRQMALSELRKYIDDAGFHLTRDSREAVRRTQRLLRDEFTSRARAIERSAAATEAAVRRAAEMPDTGKRSRLAELAERRRKLDGLAA
ncbi:dynamin family protein [Paractinoplanes deccanensis]|uniref:dynamin family protein n=1 Tax=Paractinoplanes deccanensis TaxID=113561 RepID=UPI001EF2B888|nr:dynamin family protein [Actinoplanes deccanensis]